jgi:predicted transcriptional regulator
MEDAYKRHRKLRELGSLKRVEKRMIQYRKNIVKGKWIKHRNHTYYELTLKGEDWISQFEKMQLD